MNDVSPVERIVKLEEPFYANDYNGSGKNNFVIEPGTIPIMISAPYSVKHFRNGIRLLKEEELKVK